MNAVTTDLWGGITYSHDEVRDTRPARQYRFVDLFCGIGAFHLAWTRLAAGRCVLACDVCIHAEKAYKLNYPGTPYIRNIYNVNEDNLPQHDVICGGFPCQPFSIGGIRQGFADTNNRGMMFFEILRLAAIHKTKVLILENVLHMLFLENGKYLQAILQALDDAGYDVFMKCLSPHTHCNIPQMRKRIFFVCFRKDLQICNFCFPRPRPLTITCMDYVASDDNVPEWTWVQESWEAYTKRKLQNYTDLPVNTVIHSRCGSVRVYKQAIPTIVRHTGSGRRDCTDLVHLYIKVCEGKRFRLVTVAELQRFMGFPVEFTFPADILSRVQMGLLGNSIVVPCAELIVNEVTRILDTL